MRFMRLLVVTLIALGLASPVRQVHAGTHKADLGPPELKIVSQPFNVFTAVNARFVLSPNRDTFVAADDRL